MLAKSLLIAAAFASAIPAAARTAQRAVPLAAKAALPSRAVFASDRIVVTTVGSGPDVILIPGLSSSPRVWASTVAAVPGYRYHLVQVKGFAGVPAEANATGNVAAPVAAEIARYITAAKLTRPAVIGHSMGGTIGLMLAARNPQAVGKLMVVDMMPFMGAVFGPPGASAESIRPMAEQIRTMMSAPSSPQTEQMQTQTINGMVRTTSARPAILADSRSSDRKASTNSFYELLTTDLRPELPRITAPVKVLYVTPTGVPLTDAQMDGFYKSAYAAVPNVTLTRVPESAHFIMIDQAARFQAEVKSFLAK